MSMTTAPFLAEQAGAGGVIRSILSAGGFLALMAVFGLSVGAWCGTTPAAS